jgi:hypothetical protein
LLRKLFDVKMLYIYDGEIKMKYDLAKKDINYLDRFWSGILLLLEHVFKKSIFIQNLKSKNINNLSSKIKKKRQFEGQEAGFEKGNIVNVDRVTEISESDFVNIYLKNHTPVIFDGAAKDWACTIKWDLDYLNNKYGEKKFKLITRDGVIDPKEL